jgi:hypothetical protein
MALAPTRLLPRDLRKFIAAASSFSHLGLVSVSR